MFLRFAPNDKPETGALSAAYPTQAQRQGLTPISCHAVLERSAYAPFIKEKVHGVYQRHKPPQEIGAHGAPMVRCRPRKPPARSRSRIIRE
jgi:hypothetical protein